ncbi:MAG: hypothetical protein ACYC4U_08395 [Pirellulaceae bacterium]
MKRDAASSKSKGRSEYELGPRCEKREEVKGKLHRTFGSPKDVSDIPSNHGAPTVDVPLISSGHALVDANMTFDTDEFAWLF